MNSCVVYLHIPFTKSPIWVNGSNVANFKGKIRVKHQYKLDQSFPVVDNYNLMLPSLPEFTILGEKKLWKSLIMAKCLNWL